MTQVDLMEQSTTLNRPSMRERAIALAPGIAERAKQIDEQRHVDDQTIQELVDSGLTRALQPVAYGGEEAHPADFEAAVIEIGKACASTAWVLSILALHNWQLAHFEPSLQEEVFGQDPTTLISSSYAQRGSMRKVQDGWLLSGKWSTSSGIVHSKYTIIGVDVEVDGEMRAHDVVVPLSDVTVVDDWYVIGLRGTGSRSLVAEDVFIPDNHVVDRDVVFAKLGPGLKQNPGTLFKIDQGAIYATVAACPALGAGWHFYEEFKRQIHGYVRRVDQQPLEQENTVLLRLADSNAILRDQEALILRHMNEAWDRAERGEEYTAYDLGIEIFDMARTSRAVLQVPQMLMPVLTAYAVSEGNPMQQIYRDMLVARQHGTQNVDLHGAAMMNIELGNEAASRFILSPERRMKAERRAAELYG